LERKSQGSKFAKTIDLLKIEFLRGEQAPQVLLEAILFAKHLLMGGVM